MVSASQMANAKKLFDQGIIEQDESNENVFYIIGKPYIIEFTPSTNSYYCKNCQGWMNCKGKFEDKTCKHVEAVKMWKESK